MSKDRLKTILCYLMLQVTLCNGQFLGRSTFTIKIPPLVSPSFLPIFTEFICGKTSLCNQANYLFKCPIKGMICEACSCDDACVRYGTCCFDKYATLNKIPKGESHARCVSPVFKKSNRMQINNYTMIASCPRESSTGNHYFCSNPDGKNIDHYVPVQGNLSGREWTFRNRFCAQCHGLGDRAVRPWMQEYKCKGFVDYSNIITQNDYQAFVRSSNSCAILAKPYGSAVVSRCGYDLHNTTVVSTCKINVSVQIRQVCQNIRHEITIKSGSVITMYKNEFCAFCNGVLLLRSDHGYVCDKGGQTVLNTAPLSVLLNFNRPESTPEKHIATYECDNEMVYDSINKYCRPVYCPVGMLVRNHSCYDLVPSAFGVGYRSAYSLIPTKRFKISTNEYDASIYLNNYMAEINHILGQVGPEYYSHQMRYVYIQEGTFITVQNLTVYTKIIPGLNRPRHLSENILIDIQTKLHYWYLNNNPEHLEISERYPELLDDTNERLFSHRIQETRITDTNITIHTVYSKQFYVKRYFIIPPAYLISDKYFRLVNDLLSCPMIRLNHTEYKKLTRDNSIRVEWLNTVFKVGEYRLHDREIYICTRFKGFYNINDARPTKSNNKYPEYDYEETVLTIVCITVSLLGLFITLITYVVLPHLKTMPGKNNMFLFSTIFVAQLMFITTIRADVSQKTCSILGAVNHYFLLAMFFWKSACAFHMYRSFCRPSAHISHTKWLCIYSAYSYTAPILIIGVYVLVNLTTSNWSFIGYGGMICFLSTNIGIGLGFALPVAIILCVNAIFFFKVIRELNKSQTEITKIGISQNFDYNVLYFKMSLLLGFTWAVGFIAAATSFNILWHLFSFLNSTIGLFVCFTYVMKTDVITMLRKRFSCSKTAPKYDKSISAQRTSSHTPIVNVVTISLNDISITKTSEQTKM